MFARAWQKLLWPAANKRRQTDFVVQSDVRRANAPKVPCSQKVPFADKSVDAVQGLVEACEGIDPTLA
ncbi:hypothetical protein EOM89_02695 [Candidatus Falkowbacteria bacterium]|nr:hypothetical protein [Candidatus Falkowbacteria bacterium]